LGPTYSGWTDHVTVTLTLEVHGLPAWSPNGEALALELEEGLAIARAPSFVPRTIYTGSVVPQWWGGPNLLWHPDRDAILFHTMTDREVGGEMLPVESLGRIVPGCKPQDLLLGWRAGSTLLTKKGIVGWLDREKLAFHVHCGTECERLYGVDLTDDSLLCFRVYGPRFHVRSGNPWIVAQRGPTGGMDFILIYRDDYTVVGSPGDMPDCELHSTTPSTARALPVNERAGSAFADWAPDGRRLLAVAWDRGWMPLVETAPDLYVWDVTGDEVSLIARDVLDAAWSPEGKYIALLVPGEPTVRNGEFLGTDYAPDEPFRYATLVLEAETGKVRFAEKGPVGRPEVNRLYYRKRRPRWSPRGTLLLYFDATGGLAYYRPSTGAQGLLAQGGELPPEREYVNIGFSSDEHYLTLTYGDQWRANGSVSFYLVDLRELVAS
jgi:hypothetical protein